MLLSRLLTSVEPGYNMPLLGFGVYQNYTTQESVQEALRAGYRWASMSAVVCIAQPAGFNSLSNSCCPGMLTQHKHIATKRTSVPP